MKPHDIRRVERANAYGLPNHRRLLASAFLGINTPDTAIRLGAATGVGAEFWLNLQHDYDMRLARQEKGKEYATIKLLSELALTKAA